MKKMEIKFSKSAGGRRGCGFVSWAKFSALLRAANILLEGQYLEKVVVEPKGITFTTDKTGNQK